MPATDRMGAAPRARYLLLSLCVIAQLVLGAGLARAGHNVSTTTLAFTATEGGPNPANQTFTFAGPATCNGGAVSDNASWISTSPTTLPDYTSDSSTTITVSVNISGLTAGPYSGTVTVDPIDGNPAANEPCDGVKVVTVDLTVSEPTPSNSAPAIASTNATSTTNEGSTATNSGTWSDANAGDTVSLSASIGTVTKSGTNASGTWNWSFGTSDGPDESQTVTIMADDGNGGVSSTSFSLVVDNVAPTATLAAGNDLDVDEGDSVVYSYSVADPGDDHWDSDVDCGANGSLVGSPGATSFECLFADGDAGSTISVSSTDSDGDQGNTATQNVTINNVAPTTTLSSENLLSVDEDMSTTVGYTYSVQDPGNDTWTSTPSCGASGSLGATTATSFQCTFPDGDASSTVTVSSTDSDGDQGNTATQTVNIDNVAPTSALDSDNDLTVDEGSTVTYGFSVSEPGDDTWTSSAGCGLAGSLGSSTATSFDCTFADGSASSTISVSSTDSDLETGNTATQIVTVNNVAPTTTLSATNTLVVDEGGSLTFTFSVSDPGNDTWTSAFDCGGGSAPTASTATTFTCSFPDGPASVQVGVSSTDSDGDAGNTANQTVTVTNVAPTTTLSATNTLVVDEGGSLTFTFSVSDPGNDTWTSAFDCGGGSAPTASTATTFTCSFPDGPASVQVGVSSTDSDGDAGNTANQTVTVNNVAPTTTLSATNTLVVDEDAAGSVVYAFSVTDPGQDTWTSSPSCGSGGSLQSSTASSFTCRFADGPAAPTVSVSSTDSDGDTGNTSTQSVTVNNVDPVVTASFVAALVSCGANNATLNISFTDPGADTHSASIAWGDGSPLQAISSISSPASISHTYASAGGYNASVTITDDDSGSGWDSSNAVAVNYTIENGGFLPPINNDGSSVYKYNSTIPVKIRARNCDGSYPSGLAPTIKLTKMSDSAPSTDINEPTSTSAVDTAGVMRWSASDSLYIYNLATKPLDPTSTYRITVTIPSTGQTVVVNFGLKK